MDEDDGDVGMDGAAVGEDDVQLDEDDVQLDEDDVQLSSFAAGSGSAAEVASSAAALLEAEGDEDMLPDCESYVLYPLTGANRQRQRCSRYETWQSTMPSIISGECSCNAGQSCEGIGAGKGAVGCCLCPC